MHTTFHIEAHPTTKRLQPVELQIEHIDFGGGYVERIRVSEGTQVVRDLDDATAKICDGGWNAKVVYRNEIGTRWDEIPAAFTQITTPDVSK